MLREEPTCITSFFAVLISVCRLNFHTLRFSAERNRPTRTRTAEINLSVMIDQHVMVGSMACRRRQQYKECWICFADKVQSTKKQLVGWYPYIILHCRGLAPFCRNVTKFLYKYLISGQCTNYVREFQENPHLQEFLGFLTTNVTIYCEENVKQAFLFRIQCFRVIYKFTKKRVIFFKKKSSFN